MKLRLLLGAFILCFGLSSCDKRISISNTSATPDVKELKLYDIAYGAHPAHKMDICLPKSRNASTPVVILLHGSYWSTGVKESMSRWQDSFLNNSIGAININFRNADTADIHYQEIIEDIHSAINYITAHSKEWNIKSTGYVLVGMNSGGHMALLYTHKYNYDNVIKATIALASASDLTDDMYLSNMIAKGKLDELRAITGMSFISGSGLPTPYIEASPRFFPKKIPTLMIHGKTDDVVPYNQADAYHLILDNAKCVNRLYTLPTAGHDLNLNNTNTAGVVFHEMSSWCWQFGS